jgi:hypothetical protein
MEEFLTSVRARLYPLRRFGYGSILFGIPQAREGDSSMARKVQVILEDDIDGGEAAETVSFALDGRGYQIDLNEKNAKSLRDALAPWIAAGRRAGSRSVETRASGRRAAGDTADIRRWATENGIEVSTRGRISADLRARYEAAH